MHVHLNLVMCPEQDDVQAVHRSQSDLMVVLACCVHHDDPSIRSQGT
jgi:hypothetical protein